MSPAARLFIGVCIASASARQLRSASSDDRPAIRISSSLLPRATLQVVAHAVGDDGHRMTHEPYVYVSQWVSARARTPPGCRLSYMDLNHDPAERRVS